MRSPRSPAERLVQRIELLVKTKTNVGGKREQTKRGAAPKSEAVSREPERRGRPKAQKPKAQSL